MPRYVVATHAALFEASRPKLADGGPAPSKSCDVCGAAIEEPEDGFALPGRGLYLWERGGERRDEEPALCADCGTAIGVTAQASWDAGEDEG